MIFDVPTNVSFTFFFSNLSAPQLQLQMQLEVEFSLSKLYQAIFSQASPSFLDDVNVLQTIDLAFSTFDYNGIPTGISVGTTSVFSNATSSNSLLKAFQVLQPNALNAKLVTSLYIPILSQNPQYVSFKLSEAGSFPLGSSIECNSVQLDVAVSDATTISLSSEIQLTLQRQQQPLVFDVSANWQEQSSVTSFSGSLRGQWTHPFGFSWLDSISGASLLLSVGPSAQTQSISITGTGTFSFAPSTTSAVSINVQATGDFLFSVSNLPLVSLDSLYSQVLGQPTPDVIKQISLSGAINFALASYASGAVSQGLTVSGSVTVASGQSLSQALQVLHSEPSAQAYQFSLSIPLFSANPLYVSFSLSESGTFALTPSINVASYQVSVSISQQVSISLATELQVTLKNQQQPLVVDATATWDQQNQKTSFHGAIKGEWDHPFGLSWINSLTGASLTLEVGTSADVTSIAISGTTTFSFASSTPVVVTIDVLANGDFLLSVTNIPIPGLDSFYTTVVGKPTPDVVNQITVNGQASIAIASYNAGNYKEGLDLLIQATVSSGGSLFKASQVLKSTPSSQSYELLLNIPVFSSNPEYLSISLTESGSFSLTKNSQISSYSVNVAISQDIAISLAAKLNVTTHGQSTIFDITSSWSEQSEQFTFAGAIDQPWKNPFGLSWLTAITSASVSFTIDGQRQVATFSITGSASLSFAPTPVQITLALDTDGGFLIGVQNVPINNLVFLYYAVVGQSPQDFLLQMTLQQGTVSFFVTNSDSYSQARKGLTLTSDIQLLQGTLYDALKVYP